MESNVKVPFVSPEHLAKFPGRPINVNDAIDQITGAKGLLNIIITAADEDGIGDAALAAHDRLSKAMEMLDKPVRENSANLQSTSRVDAPNAAADQRQPKHLTRFDYLNRSFIPQGADEQHCEEHRVSGLAGDLWAMLATIETAFDAESARGDGISTTLHIAKYMASDLIEMCEFLERDLSAAKKQTGEANA